MDRRTLHYKSNPEPAKAIKEADLAGAEYPAYKFIAPDGIRSSAGENHTNTEWNCDVGQLVHYQNNRKAIF
jgi:hypothetical protein